MNQKFFLVLMSLTLLVSACSGAGSAASATAEPIPTVLADDTILAEGFLEPAHFAQVVFQASDRVLEVLVQQGQSVQQGQPLVRLGGDADSAFAAAQMEKFNS